ncbi:MAG: ABC transporter ATP-binding protein [Aquincola tertiaricarbonis]
MTQATLASHPTAAGPLHVAASRPLLALQAVGKRYTGHGGTAVHALDGIDLQVGRHETLGLVGESGCGKSTLARAVMRLVSVDEGRIVFDGDDITHRPRRALAPQRARMQMVFQDPYASLNPRLTIGRALEEPLRVQGRGGSSAERRERVQAMLARVGLRPEMAQRHPHEFSGGQRQRVAIARALMLEPELLVCDEAVSALDVSVRAQVLNLLLDLREHFGLAGLFISHDLAVVRHMADRVAVMFRGRVVELAPRDSLWRTPLHPYTRTLIAATPGLHRPAAPVAPAAAAEAPAAAEGCAFRHRCPLASSRCRTEAPPLRPMDGGHQVACHHV